MPTEDLTPCSDDFAQLIEYATAAGRNRYWARKEPKARRGLLRCAARHSAVAAALLEQIMLEAARPGLMDAPPTIRPRWVGEPRRMSE